MFNCYRVVHVAGMQALSNRALACGSGMCEHLMDYQKYCYTIFTKMFKSTFVKNTFQLCTSQ